MSILPHQNPVEPDSPEQRDPIHHPHKQDHPGPDDHDELPESDEDEDTDADPWWMGHGARQNRMAIRRLL